MIKIITYIFIGFLVSFYFFPITFTFLPSGLNTKMILGVLGIFFAGLSWLETQNLTISRGLLISIIISLLFSFICYYSTDINNTTDYSYASYIVSFSVWFFGAFAVCYIIRYAHGGKASLRILTNYLAAVCFFQCVAAIMIDNIPSFKLLVDSVVNQGQDFFDEVNRLYGIGAALDSAGVRFSLVLVLITASLNNSIKTRGDTWNIALLLIAFFTISVIGNAIARTTILGVTSSLIYFLVGSGLFRKIIKMESIKLGVLFGFIFLFAVFLTVYLYNTNQAFYDQMRFAFEGFFNWIEHGEWRTGSTDKLNREMWIWPEDQKTWLIGSGKFGMYEFSTDIGYCRFILYCGLIGFSVFALLFVFNALYFMNRYPKYWMMFAIFLVLTFIFWIKVATDIFFIYALFYCLDTFSDEEEDKMQELDVTDKNEKLDENSLLYPRYI